MLHIFVPSPTQFLPPFARAGLLHVLVSVPPPQLFEHASKPDHPPSRVLSPVMPSATQSVCQQCATTRPSTHRNHQQKPLLHQMLGATKQTPHLIHTNKPTSRTCTGLRIACADRIANTMFAAIRRRRVAARSLVSPAATSPGASAVTRPSSVQYTVARNAVCNTVQTPPTQFNVKEKLITRQSKTKHFHSFNSVN